MDSRQGSFVGLFVLLEYGFDTSPCLPALFNTFCSKLHQIIWLGSRMVSISFGFSMPYENNEVWQSLASSLSLGGRCWVGLC